MSWSSPERGRDAGTARGCKKRKEGPANEAENLVDPFQQSVSCAPSSVMNEVTSPVKSRFPHANTSKFKMRQTQSEVFITGKLFIAVKLHKL